MNSTGAESLTGHVLQALDLNRILLAIHGYFSSMTSQEIKARGLQEDKPLRMAKTLLHKICGLAVSFPAVTGMKLPDLTAMPFICN